jgi:hypothetical protein
MMTKLDGSCEKTMVVGEIELRTGTGRALPQRGFSVLHPGRSKSTTRHELRRTLQQEEGMNFDSATMIGLSHLILLGNTVHVAGALGHELRRHANVLYTDNPD